MSLDHLAVLQDLLREDGWSRALIWDEENRWVDVRGVRSPTAFVEVDSKGRQLDIHVVQV